MLQKRYFSSVLLFHFPVTKISQKLQIFIWTVWRRRNENGDDADNVGNDTNDDSDNDGDGDGDGDSKEQLSPFVRADSQVHDAHHQTWKMEHKPFFSS